MTAYVCPDCGVTITDGFSSYCEQHALERYRAQQWRYYIPALGETPETAHLAASILAHSLEDIQKYLLKNDCWKLGELVTVHVFCPRNDGCWRANVTYKLTFIPERTFSVELPKCNADEKKEKQL